MVYEFEIMQNEIDVLARVLLNQPLSYYIESVNSAERDAKRCQNANSQTLPFL